MIKVIRDHINQKIIDWMLRKNSDFLLVNKNLARTSLNGCNVFCRSLDNERRSWIVIGGTTDGDFLMAALYWTTEGTRWENLRFWDFRKHPTVPPTGGVYLTSPVICGDDLIDGDRMLGIKAPDSFIQEKAFQAYKRSELYKRTREKLAVRLKCVTPDLTDAEIDLAKEKQSRSTFCSWQGIAEIIPIDNFQCEAASDLVLNKAFYLLEKYGIPFLGDRCFHRTLLF